MSSPNAAQLNSAKRVVERVMKTRGAEMLFNVPVDPVAFNLPDYHDVITDPIDLGTIHKRLLDGYRNDWDVKSYYQRTEDIFNDVSRVWSNCYTYNKGPGDAQIRNICHKTQEHFESKWLAAALPTPEAKMGYSSNEADVPERYSLRNPSVELPVRMLDVFCIQSILNPEDYVALDDVSAENIKTVQASGTLIQPSDPDGERFSVALVSLVDWCFQYGSLPGIWLITHQAWYKLLNPADVYVPFLSGTLHKFMVSLSVINPSEGASFRSAESSHSSGNDTETPSLPDEIVEMLMEDESVKQGTLMLMKKRSRSSSRGTGEENGASRAADSAASSYSQETEGAIRSDEGGGELVVSPQRSLRSHKPAQRCAEGSKTGERRVAIKLSSREKSASRKKQRVHSPNPVNDVAITLSELDEDDPLFDPTSDVDVLMKEEDDEDYVHETGRRHRSKRVGESEAQRARREKKAQEQLKREQEADRRRGAPPPVTSDFRIPQELIGMALSCWDFLMTFHIKLELPPFPFWRFEAIVCPLHQNIKKGWSKAAEEAALDMAAKSSAQLLRDIHLSLCRVLQGKTPFTKDTPTHAALDTKPPSGPHWSQSMSLLLLKSSLEDVDEDTRSIATFLHGHEYLDLSVRARLKILCTLIDMVISTDVFRDHLNGLVEKLTSQKVQPYEEKPLNVAVLESMSLSFERKAANLSAEKWTHWFLAHRIGVLSAMGQDFRGTQYWVMGGISGCYRIYVEYRPAYELSLKGRTKPSRSRGRSRGENLFWGWYEGESIPRFIEWLEKGDLDSEKPLLEALNHIPKPVQLERSRSHSDGSTLNIISLGYHKIDRAMLEVYRMDGYSEIRYPLLRGEGEITEAAHEVHPATRIFACLRALLSTIPFWERDTDVKDSMCSILEKAQSSQETGAMAHEVRRMMDLVCEHGAVREDWKMVKKAWESQLHNGASLHSIMAHLTLFQSFVLSPAHSVHRPAFNVMIQDAKCPLYFPMPGECVAVLKTGCLAHLERYLEVSRQTLATPTAAASFKLSHHPEFVTMAQKCAESLSPVEYFRVWCIGYRSPYPDAPPEGTELAEDVSIPVQPCMWLLLASLRDVTSATVLPIHVDNALPDYLVKVSAYEESRRINWKTGDRFKMFFGGKGLTRGATGVYYKGTISSVKQPVQGEAYDPWESLTVEWDNDHSGASMKVSPWEIEVDPEEQRKLEEARLRQLESRARQGRALSKQHRTEYLADIVDGDDAQSVGDPDYDPLADYEGGGGNGGKSSGRPRRRGSALHELVYYDPKNPSGPVPPEMIALVPGPHEFPILIHNFMQRLKGKFKCPVFSGKDLDLYKVFHEVQQRGGYEVVTSVKLWKDVCRTLNVNLKGQTSASYNMRLNYEKCLLDFEHYLASGRYSQELKDGTAPSSTVFDTYPQKLRGVELDAALSRGAATDGAEADQMVTRGARRHMSASMTQLLMGEGSAAEWGTPKPPVNEKRTEYDRVVSASQYKRTLQDQKSSAWVSPVMQGTENEIEAEKQLMNSRRGRVEIQPGESIGMALDRLGWALVGCHVWRRWPGKQDWSKVEVTGFNRQTNEHCLTSNKGQPTELSEWVDLRELEGEELSQCDPGPTVPPPVIEPPVQKPLVGTLRPQRNELSQLLAPPRALQRFGTETAPESVTSLSAAAQSGMDPMDWFHQILSSGMNPDVLEQIADDKAVHRIYEEATQDNFASLVPPSRLSQTPAVGQLAALLTEGTLQTDLKPDSKNKPGPSVKRTDEGDGKGGPESL